MKALLCAAVIAHLWYPTDCCGGNECRPIPCDQLDQQLDGSVTYLGMKFKGSMVRSSLDAQCHVCYDKNRMWPYCVFMQNNT